MENVPATIFRQSMVAYMDKVTVNRTPLLITRRDSEAVVLLSLKDFQEYEETMHMMSSKKNSRALSAAISELENGQGSGESK